MKLLAARCGGKINTVKALLIKLSQRWIHGLRKFDALLEDVFRNVNKFCLLKILGVKNDGRLSQTISQFQPSFFSGFYFALSRLSSLGTESTEENKVRDRKATCFERGQLEEELPSFIERSVLPLIKTNTIELKTDFFNINALHSMPAIECLDNIQPQ